MAAAWVQSLASDVDGNGTSSVTITLTNTPTVGNMMILSANFDTTTIDITSVTDSAGNTWQQDRALGASGNEEPVVWSAIVTSVPTTVTYNLSAINRQKIVVIDEISGVDTSASRVDTGAGASTSGTGTSFSLTSGTPSEDGIAIGVVAWKGGSGAAPAFTDNTFTGGAEGIKGSGQHDAIHISYDVLTSGTTGTWDGSWTTAPASPGWLAAILFYKAATSTITAGVASSTPTAYGPGLTPGSVTLTLGEASSSPTAYGPGLSPGSVTLTLGEASSTPTAYGADLCYPITVDASTNGNSSLTYAHTVSGSNRYLVVGVVYGGTTTTSTGVDYNGVAMTLLHREVGSSITAETWGLVAPDTGTNNVVITRSGSAGFATGAVSLNSVDQTNPVVASGGNNGTGTTTATGPSLSTHNGGIIVDIIGAFGAISAANGTEAWNDTGGDAMSYLSTDGTAEHTDWSDPGANSYGISATSLLPVCGVAGPQTITAGVAASTPTGYGPTLTPGSITLTLGEAASIAAALGLDLSPAAVTLTLGVAQSVADALGADLSPAAVTLVLGVAASTPVARGVSLAPSAVALDLGFAQSLAVAFGIDLRTAILASPYNDPLNAIELLKSVNQASPAIPVINSIQLVDSANVAAILGSVNSVIAIEEV